MASVLLRDRRGEDTDTEEKMIKAESGVMQPQGTPTDTRSRERQRRVLLRAPRRGVALKMP